MKDEYHFVLNTTYFMKLSNTIIVDIISFISFYVLRDVLRDGLMLAVSCSFFLLTRIKR
jgi:hypothetical protein